MTKFQCAVSADLLARAFLVASTEETRYYLKGVHVAPCSKGGVTLVATDGHGLLAFRDPLGFANFGAIVSADPAMRKALAAASKDKHARHVYTANEGKAAVYWGEEAETVFAAPALAVFDDLGAENVVARQFRDTEIDGSFPDWRRVIPSGASAAVGLGCLDAKKLAVLATALCDAKNSAVIVTADAQDTDDKGARGAMLVKPGVASARDGFGLLMPIRYLADGRDAVPAWARNV